MKCVEILLLIILMSYGAIGNAKMCNFHDSSKEFTENTRLVKALNERGVFIGIKIEEAKVKYTNLTDTNKYMDNDIVEAMSTLGGRAFVCIGEGVSSISYRSKDNYPFIIQYCSLLPGRYISDSQVYRYIRNTYNLAGMADRVLSDRGRFRNAFYHISDNSRFYNVQVKIHYPIEKYKKSVKIMITDITYYVNKQKECEDNMANKRN